MQLIGHIDADCFYVSCERVRRTELLGMPVGILSNQGACVIAKSYELKAHGVTTGMAIWDAVPLCPEAIYIKRDFHWYEVLSRKLLEVVRSVSPTVEYYSIDEQFFDASRLRRQEILALQKRVMNEVGIPVSIGVSRSKTLAKLATSIHKPFGCGTLIEEDEIESLLRELPVDKITGIARRRARRLASYGITTCEQFRQADRKLVRRLLTKTGEELWWELQGVAVKKLEPQRPAHKEISRGGSVGRATDDRDRLHAWAVRNTERLIEALDHHDFYCDRLSLMLQYKAGLYDGTRLRLPESTANFALLCEAALHMFYYLWNGGLVQYMHLIAGNLTFRTKVQKSLWGASTQRDRRIASTKREVNQKIGRFILRSGATLPLFDLYHDEASDYDICDIYGKSCF